MSTRREDAENSSAVDDVNAARNTLSGEVSLGDKTLWYPAAAPAGHSVRTVSLRDFFGDMELRSIREATTQPVKELFLIYLVCTILVAAPVLSNPVALSCMASAPGGGWRVTLGTAFVAGTCFPAAAFSAQTARFILRYLRTAMPCHHVTSCM